ncbi:MAG: hypothetical protein V4525_12050 [Pseudomonadota bacterium]
MFFLKPFSYYQLNYKSYTKWLTFLIISLAVIFSRSTVMVEPGVAWKTLVADRLIHGLHYKTDILEFNTPFNTLLYAPAILISKFINTSPFIINYIIVSITIILCLILSEKILVHRGYSSFKHYDNQYFFKLSFFLGFTIFSSIGFAEGEHFITALMLPLALIKFSPQRFQESPFEKKYLINIISILLASLTFLIKPYYILSLFIIDIFNCFFHKKLIIDWQDWLIRLAILIINILIIYLFFHEWIVSLQDAWLTYDGYKKAKIDIFIELGAGVITQFFALVLFYKYNPEKLQSQKNFLSAISAMSIANSIIFIIQSKGFYYHKLTVCLPLWGLMLFNYLNWFHSKWKKTFLLILSILIINHVFLYYMEHHFQAENKKMDMNRSKIIQKNLSNNEYFLCLSYRENCAFLLHAGINHQYGSRSLALYSLNGARNLFLNKKLERNYFDFYLSREINNLQEDIQKKHPPIIIIEWWKNKNNSIADFSEKKQFSTTIKDYKLIQFTTLPTSSNKATWIFHKKYKQ